MLSLLPMESNLFDSIAGLPMHPLVVHLAVVILPVSALALVVLAFIPRLAQRYGWLAVSGIAVGTVAAFVAKESGEALAAQVGEPAQHAQYGDLLPPVAAGLLVIAVVWWLMVRGSGKRAAGGSVLRLAVGLVAALAALATVGLTVVVGHSGAQAVWAGEVAASGSGDWATPSPEAPSATKSTAASTTKGTYTLAQVAQHATAASCWAVVSKNVYDLTDWVDRHPGGRARILSMCGKDSTDAFTQQHGGQKRPEADLAGFKIGQLG